MRGRVQAGNGGKGEEQLFFSAEDFIKYVEWVEAERRGAMEELKRIDGKYGPHSYARMPYCRTISELNGMYEGTLSAESHGEGFIDFFKSRIIKTGFICWTSLRAHCPMKTSTCCR